MLNKMIDKFMNYFLESREILLENIDKFSFQACLIIGLVALVLSILGWDKGKKIATLSPAIYVIIQIFLEVWFGV